MATVLQHSPSRLVKTGLLGLVASAVCVGGMAPAASADPPDAALSQAGLHAQTLARGGALSVAPRSGAVGSAFKITARCTDSGPGQWSRSEVAFYYADALRVRGVPDTFALRTAAISTSGTVTGTVTVPKRANYDTSGGRRDRAVAGSVSVLVLCYRTGSVFVWQQVERPSALTIRTAKRRLGLRVAPRITGKHRVGAPLHVTTGRWNSRPTSFSYKWVRDGNAIPGAKAKRSAYRPTRADRGRHLTVHVVAKRAGFRSKTITTGRFWIR